MFSFSEQLNCADSAFVSGSEAVVWAVLGIWLWWGSGADSEKFGELEMMRAPLPVKSISGASRMKEREQEGERMEG